MALVTGGSRGLGYLLTRELAQKGYRVAICARDQGELDRAVEDLDRGRGLVDGIRCDVSRRDEVAQMVEQVLGREGRIDVLINNAGIIQVGPHETMTIEDYEQALGAMYWGVVYPTLAVLPSMRARRRGQIVNITSIGGKVSVPHLLPYCSAKFAAVGFSEGLRAELLGTGVGVTTIAPGLMRTGSYVNALFKGRQNGEFTWFSLGAALPLVSMDAERAARQIVRALERNEAERVLSVPATLLALAHGLFPGLTASILGMVNRFVLPRSGGAGTVAARGADVEAKYPSGVRRRLTALGGSAASRFHERPGPAV